MGYAPFNPYQSRIRCPRCRSPYTQARRTATDRAFETDQVESGRAAPQYRTCLNCEHRFRIFVEVIPPADQADGGGEKSTGPSLSP